MMRNFLLSRVGSLSESVQSAPNLRYIIVFSTSLLKYNFFAFLTRCFYFIACRLYSVNFLSFFSRSRSDMAWMIFLFSEGGSLERFTRLRRIGACLLTTSVNSLYHTARASLGSVCWCTLSNGVQIKSAKNAFWLKCLKDLKETCICPLGYGFGSLMDLVLIGLWSLILKSKSSVVTTAQGLFV